MSTNFLIQKNEPEIITLQRPIFMVGCSITTDSKQIYRDAVKLGKEYTAVKKSGIIQNKRVPWAFVAISKNFSESGNWEYLIGDVINDLSYVPEKLTGCEIPTGVYAKFIFQPHLKFLWGPAMGLMKKYIYTEWLPNSAYMVRAQSIGEFEYHDERSLGKHPMIELYVAVNPRRAEITPA